MGFTKYNYSTTQINYFFLLLFIFWLPLSDNQLPLILAIWIITSLIAGNLKTGLKVVYRNPIYIGLFVYFILTLFAVVYSENMKNGLLNVQEKLSFIFFPFLLASSTPLIKENSKKILLVFALGNLVAALYCLAHALFLNLVIENGDIYIRYWAYDAFKEKSFITLVTERYNLFSYENLSILKHPSYFSMYLVFSICILYAFLRQKIIRQFNYKIIAIIVILFFSIVIFLLQSRAGFISLAFVYLMIPIIEIRRKLKKRYFFYLAITFFIFASIFLSNPRVKLIVEDLKGISVNTESSNLINKDVRFQIWYSSILVIKENLWFGTSPAELTNELVNKYDHLGFKSASELRLNCHNQYLETFAGLGVFGFLSLIFILGYSFVISIKHRNYLLFFLIIILAINFLFESMLNRMAGTLFMMFFMSQFVFAKIPEFEGKSTVQISDK